MDHNQNRSHQGKARLLVPSCGSETGRTDQGYAYEDNAFDLRAVFDDALGVEKKTEDKAEAVREPSLIKALEKAMQGSVVHLSPRRIRRPHAL